MKVTKLGHSCVLVETKAGRLLVDPGNLSIPQHQDLCEIDVILYTHEHGDHWHKESLERLAAKNPAVQVVCNEGVGEHVRAVGLSYQCIDTGVEQAVAGFKLRAFASKHAEIYQEFGQVEHTGYLVDGRLFLAGDSFAVPPFAVEILAPAIVAPFCASKDVVEMVQQVKPRTVLTMHDGQLNEFGLNTWHTLLERLLADREVEIVRFPVGTEWSGSETV